MGPENPLPPDVEDRAIPVSDRPDKWTYSQTKRIARMILGPKARVKQNGGRVQIGLERNGAFLVLGSGMNWADAVRRTFLKGAPSPE